MLALKLIPLALILLIIMYLAGLSFITRHDQIKAADQRHLQPCPQTPNCVISNAIKSNHSIAPFELTQDTPAHSWQLLIQAIEHQGGTILLKDDHYLHAVFSSTLFRFRDDLEAVLKQDRIDVRSASRAGKSDFGQNRKRLEKIRALYISIGQS